MEISESLFNNPELSDIQIHIFDGKNESIFPGHLPILANGSKYFRAMAKYPRKSRQVDININGIGEVEYGLKIIQYLYDKVCVSTDEYEKNKNLWDFFAVDGVVHQQICPNISDIYKSDLTNIFQVTRRSDREFRIMMESALYQVEISWSTVNRAFSYTMDQQYFLKVSIYPKIDRDLRYLSIILNYYSNYFSKILPESKDYTYMEADYFHIHENMLDVDDIKIEYKLIDPYKENSIDQMVTKFIWDKGDGSEFLNYMVKDNLITPEQRLHAKNNINRLNEKYASFYKKVSPKIINPSRFSIM